eukprot:g2428.t1
MDVIEKLDDLGFVSDSKAIAETLKSAGFTEEKLFSVDTTTAEKVSEALSSVTEFENICGRIEQEASQLCMRLNVPKTIANMNYTQNLQRIDNLLSLLQALRMIAANRMTNISKASDKRSKIEKTKIGNADKTTANVTDKMKNLNLLVDRQKLQPSEMRILSQLNEAFRKDYRIRRQTLLYRLDVTIQSFLWSEKVSDQREEAQAAVSSLRKKLSPEPVSVTVDDVLCARQTLMETAHSRVSTGDGRIAASSKNVVIGAVPDRGGRASELRPSRTDLMPSWQKRSSKDGGVNQNQNNNRNSKNKNNRNGRGGRGGGRGHSNRRKNKNRR